MIFWILASGLIGLAMLFVVLPLLRPESSTETPQQDALNLEVFRQRLEELDADLSAGFLDQTQYSAARHDLERDLLHDLDGSGTVPSRRASVTARWAMALTLATLVPATATLMYLQFGDQEIILRQEAAAQGRSQSVAGSTEQEMPSMDVLLERLQARLKDNPDDIDGWLMIGRTYYALEQPDKGLDAMGKAYQLAPDRVDLMVAYAEALAAARPDRSLDGKPAELIHAALAKDPQNPNARWLAGLIAYQHGQFNAAAVAWQQILDELDPASKEALELQQMVEEARNRAGTPTTTQMAQAPAAAPPKDDASADVQAATSGTTSITVAVTLDSGLAAQSAPEDTVFVFARAASGPPMPLAVQRLQVKDLPAEVTLDDSMAMMPSMRLSAFPEVVVGARVSKSGEAMPQPGDLEGQSAPLRIDDTDRVSITIDQPRP